MPNKLYEYLGSRNPILAFADAQGETAKMLQQAGRHRLVTEHDGHAHTRIALTELLDWARDQRADQAFYMVGTIDEAVEKAESMGAQE